MPLLTEPLTGGYVTARPFRLLNTGELRTAVDVNVRYDNDLLWPGYARKTAVSSIDPTGLLIAKFDSGVNFHIFQQSTNVLRARELAAGASTADVSSYTVGTTLAGTSYNNQWYVFNGANVNKVLYHTGTAATAPVWQQHGLDPVTLKPGLAMTTGTWPLGTQGTGKFYEYWYTEVVVLSDGSELESDTSASAVETTPVAVTATTDAVLITIPLAGTSGLANSAATKVRIYRSTGKTFFNEKQFPVGTMIAELPVTGASGTSINTVDGNTGVTSYVFPGTVSGAGTWTNCTTAALGTDDTNRASVTVGANVVASFTVTNFTFSGIQDYIAGIELNMRCDYSVISSGGLFAEISVDGGITWSAKRSCSALVAENYRTIGGPTDRWGLSVTANGLSTTNFVLRITAIGAVSGSATARVNYVKVRVTYNGSSGSTGTAFPAVVLEIDGQISSVGSNGKPPIASTGDVFGGRLFTNDIAHPSHVRWSLASDGTSARFHAFPSVYLKDFTENNDTVTCIRTLGNRCAIGLTGQLWRANYLPTAEDAAFQTSRAFDQVDPSYGIVGPRAACVFVGADGRPTLAFLSADGLRGTDLFSTWELCPDIDWRIALSGPSSLATAVLVNNPRNYELVLYIPNGVNSTKMSTRMTFSYAPRHLKNGKLKCGGVTAVADGTKEGFSGADCAPGIDAGYSWSLYEAVKDTASGAISNKIWWVCDLGTSGSTAPSPSWATRAIYAAGVGKDWFCDELLLYRGGVPSTALTVTPTMYTGDDGTSQAGAAVTFSTGSLADFYKVPIRSRGDAISFAFAPTTDTATSCYGDIILRAEDWGEEA